VGHPTGSIPGLLIPASCSLGPVEPDTAVKVEVQITDEEKARLERFENRPSLEEVLNLHDFEVRLRSPMNPA
jgi:L-lactate dehydrogenase (cytochrome)